MPRRRLRSAVPVRWPALLAALGAAAVLVGAPRGPLDDPDPARQRPGVLLPASGARPALRIGDEFPAPGRRGLAVFVRPEQYAAFYDAVAGDVAVQLAQLRPPAELIAVLPARPAGPVLTALAIDPDGSRARAYGMPVPRDGGAPVGYAVVDSAGRVRYATLDPGVLDRLREALTMVRAAP